MEPNFVNGNKQTKTKGWQIGFTLAELLIALAILGVIATFTIPKVLNSSQNETYNSSAKEAIATVSGAFESYKLSNTVSPALSPTELTPYINYVSIDSTTVIDNTVGGAVTCSTVAYVCQKLHSGAMLLSVTPNNFGQAQSDHFIYFLYDPDGEQSNIHSINIDLFYNGRIKTGIDRTVTETTYTGATPQTWGPDVVSSWFSWN